MRSVDRVSDLEVAGEYLHWDELRRRPPPEDLDHRLWWMLIAQARHAMSRKLALIESTGGSGSGRAFVVTTPDPVLRLVHGVDQEASGRIELPEPLLNSATRHRYVVNSLIEEAITSSQLEGASTTRRGAKEMLRSGRAPRTLDERMIANNFRAMEWVRSRVAAKEQMTPSRILELHAVVVENTLQPADAAGRFRRADEDIHVVDPGDGEVHTPPPASELAERVNAMCRFANEAEQGRFIHPVVRAILLHFWLAYDHPFVDGNGRTARALFYWSMLEHGYWLTEFLSISRLLRKAPTQYARAFLYSEADADATYFVIHQLRVLRQAIDDLRGYLVRKTAEVRSAELLLRNSGGLNHRQIAILGHALREPDATYTIAAHRRSQGVVYQTARQDLLDLVERGWFEQSRQGRTLVFHAAPGLERRIEGLTSRRKT